MDEQTLFAIIGKKTIDLETAKANYSRLLRVLAEVVSGECDRSRILVNLTDETYFWAAPGERVPEPATINGLPKIVVAPEDKPDVS